ncbi:putative flippase GtrA [Hypnocyclicus thermotrophus]|uniref:Flippase GtrA n=1 Tax=Hypnocyclicus thermotrophus TaxID=1627895 RepID=A0AA46DXS9_9FUSO|nr:GtrA family protein [Hypnocyclicus thermotrophus]TDT69113.1 putative flippase GtrA [Hypnocyclicus thermotrophus]
MEIIRMFLKFGIVGASGVIVNLSVFSVLTYVFDVTNTVLTASIAFLFAVTNNFIWNFLWTFRDKGINKTIKEKYMNFMIISSINFIINLIFLEIFIRVFSNVSFLKDHLKFSKVLAQFFAIGIATIFNFLGNYFITFKDKKIEGDSNE